MKRLALVGSLLLVALLIPSAAYADLTAFFGVNPTPVNRPVRGFAVGAGLLIVGFEFEYANTSDDEVLAAPKLQTYMFNGLVQTPVPIAGLQFYGTAGGGGYRESLFETSETHVGYNIGGGVKWSLAGPLRLRLDYRVFTLQGEPRHENPHRFYAGINLKF
jgi:opacity protein-like surface antigen